MKDFGDVWLRDDGEGYPEFTSESDGLGFKYVNAKSAGLVQRPESCGDCFDSDELMEGLKMPIKKCTGCGDCNESCDSENLDARLDTDNPQKMKKVAEASRTLANHLFNMGAARIEEDITIPETEDIFRMILERVSTLDGNNNAI